MEKFGKKVTHLLDELARCSYESPESSERFLREEGYDPDILAGNIAAKVRQTIARLNADQINQKKNSISMTDK